eukprot:gene35421-47609_t
MRTLSIDVDAIVSGRRMRRNRRTDWSRRLVRETRLTVDDLIWPMFVTAGAGRRDPIPSMPGVVRLSIDEAVIEAKRAVDLGIPVVALFPYTDPALRDESGSEALNPDNLICQAVRAIRAAIPNQLGLMVDVALDPYTSHGHDGLMQGDDIINDATVAQLVQQSLVLARAGTWFWIDPENDVIFLGMIQVLGGSAARLDELSQALVYQAL